MSVTRPTTGAVPLSSPDSTSTVVSDDKQQLDPSHLELGLPLDSTHILNSPHATKAPGPFAGKGKAFWCVLSSLLVSSLLAALDLTGQYSPLPLAARSRQSALLTA